MREEMKMAPNQCLPTAPASYCPPPIREYLCKILVKHCQKKCHYVLNKDIEKSLNVILTSLLCANFSCHYVLVCVCVFLPGFGSAVTTS